MRTVTFGDVHRKRKESITVRQSEMRNLRDGSGCKRHLKMNEDMRGGRGEVEFKMNKTFPSCALIKEGCGCGWLGKCL